MRTPPRRELERMRVKTTIEVDSNLIKDTMKKKGITQKQLAEQVGLCREGLNKMLNGNIPCTESRYKAICETLGIVC